MVKILVCFKVTEDYDDVHKEEWNRVIEAPVSTGYLRRSVSCFDEAALESALTLKDAYSEMGIEAEVTAVTAAPGYAGSILKGLFAVKIDRVAVIETDGDLRFRPKVTAELLSRWARENGPFDIVLMGRQSPPGSSGMVPYMFAENLGLISLGDVSEMHPQRDSVRIVRDVPGGSEEAAVSLPFAALIGNSKTPYLRAATLRDKMKVKSMEPETVFMPTAAAESLPEMYGAGAERECKMLDCSDLASAAGEVYGRFIERR